MLSVSVLVIGTVLVLARVHHYPHLEESHLHLHASLQDVPHHYYHHYYNHDHCHVQNHQCQKINP